REMAASQAERAPDLLRSPDDFGPPRAGRLPRRVRPRDRTGSEPRRRAGKGRRVRPAPESDRTGDRPRMAGVTRQRARQSGGRNGRDRLVCRRVLTAPVGRVSDGAGLSARAAFRYPRRGMRLSTMRRVDYFVGTPLCALAAATLRIAKWFRRPRPGAP